MWQWPALDLPALDLPAFDLRLLMRRILAGVADRELTLHASQQRRKVVCYLSQILNVLHRHLTGGSSRDGPIEQLTG
jgi:hypothetical protein